MDEHNKIKRDLGINAISQLKLHEYLRATKCEDFEGKPYWRIDGRSPNQFSIEEISFCPPSMIRSKLRHNDAKIIDWFTNTGAGTI